MSTSQPNSIADTRRFNLLSHDPEMIAIRALLQILVASGGEPNKALVRKVAQQIFSAERISSMIPLQYGEDRDMERFLDTIHQFFEAVLIEDGKTVF